MFLEEDKQLSKVKLTELKNKSSLFGPELSTTPAETAISGDFDLNIDRKERDETSSI